MASLRSSAAPPHPTPATATALPQSHSSVQRRLPIGAELQPDGGTHFRVWAPNRRAVAVELYDPPRAPQLWPLAPEPGGYFSGLVKEARAGFRYRLRLENGAFPDPASRFQPEGPHGPSEIVDPSRFAWSDQAWPGPPPHGQVLYELHLGTFTPDGTWRAAAAHLPALQQLGVTTLELMPIADFPGEFGWGYDGVNLFAPTRLYGRPDDARAFVDRAHALGLAVILDVVYNHLGPDGNYLPQFAADYHSRSRKTEWGEALNFDRENSGPVRELFVTNARYWIEEFHFDGLRLDATQQIFDDSPTHLVAEVAESARSAGGNRRIYLVAENEPQQARLAQPRAQGGHGLDAVWNDDFHHTAKVAATGRAEAYYSDYHGSAQEFVAMLKYGFLFQGAWCRWQGKRRGQPAFDLRPEQFVQFLQNHDQVANSATGERLHQLTSPGRLRALTAMLLLAPQTPMLFQGQEFSASTPFRYFADHHGPLRQLVGEGRRKFLEQFPTIATPEGRAGLIDPADRAAFIACRLDHGERERHAAAYRLHADLLRLRRNEVTLIAPRAIDGAVLDDQAFALRYFSPGADDRLLLVNLGRECPFTSVHPLLAPPEAHDWSVLWSSESTEYGGHGTPPSVGSCQGSLPGEMAVLLRPTSAAKAAT